MNRTLMYSTKRSRSALRFASVLVLAFCAVALSSCSDRGGSLSGSLSSFYDLSFNHTRARLYSSELAIEYVTEAADVPVRVSLDVRDGISPGSYNLVDRGAVTGRRGDKNIPRMVSGTLDLRDYERREGARVRGSFEAKFSTGDDESTLSGSFDTQLEIVENPRGYDAGLEPDAGDAGDAQDGAGSDE